MKRMLCLLSILAVFTQHLIDMGVDTRFIETCHLVTQAAEPTQTVYELYGQALDAVDAVADGNGSASAALTELISLVAQLRALAPAALEPTDEALALLTERGLLLEDFQAALNDAVYSAGYYADSLDVYIQYWTQYPDAPAPDTRVLRLSMQYENKLNFIAFNTLLFPQTDEEAQAIDMLVVNITPFLADAGLPWERDLTLCLAKYDAMEAEYAAKIDALQAVMDEAESALDAAAP